MSSKVYKNVPLADVPSIRLLLLRPAERLSAPIVATLRTALLSEKPDYQALSYTWGPPFEGQTLSDQQISIDGKPLTVTGNLLHALQRIRQHDERRPLWVDAICIDQGNDEEKSRQVGMMAEIYHAASEVLVWLGEDSVERDGEYILHIDKPPLDTQLRDTQLRDTQLRDAQLRGTKNRPTPKFLRAAKRIFKNRTAETPRFQWSGDELDQRDEGELDRRDDLIDQKLDCFTKRRYFRRRWVVQEMHQARQVTFCCGRIREPWSSIFSGVQRVYNEFHYNLSDTTSPFAPKTRHVRGTPIWILDNLEAWTRNEPQPYAHTLISDYSTLDILMDFQSFECSDPRDRLYALSNLFSGARNFPADYSSPWRTVYTNFVQHCLESEPAETPYFQHLSEKSSKTLSVLLILAAQQASKRGESASSEEELPSWVPDWQQSFDKVEPLSIDPVEGAEIRERRLFAGLYQCGTFRNRGPEGQQTLDFVDMNGRSYDDAERYLPLRQPFSPDCQDGDLVCGPLCHHMTSFGSFFALVLRPTGHDLQVHRITGLYAISMSAFQDEDVSKLPRVARHFEII